MLYQAERPFHVDATTETLIRPYRIEYTVAIVE